MWIDVYAVLHNEARLLPFWLRHYAALADRIFVWDDDSTDATPDLLRAEPKVTLLSCGMHGNNDDYRVEVLFPQYERYSRGMADWVIVADGDEFIYHPRLREVLQAELLRGTQVIKCAGFTMVADALPPDTGQTLTDTLKLGVPDYDESKWTVHVASATVRYRHGRHGTVLNRHQLRLRGSRVAGLRLLHYRYLGAAYYLERNQRNHERSDQVYHHRVPFNPHAPLTMPDHTKADPLAWYTQHLARATNVVDEGW